MSWCKKKNKWNRSKTNEKKKDENRSKTNEKKDESEIQQMKPICKKLVKKIFARKFSVCYFINEWKCVNC